MVETAYSRLTRARTLRTVLVVARVVSGEPHFWVRANPYQKDARRKDLERVGEDMRKAMRHHDAIAIEESVET